jgi:PAS domain S-box-containing protein
LSPRPWGRITGGQPGRGSAGRLGARYTPLIRDAQKTKAELIAELDALREKVRESTGEPTRQAVYESEERYRIVTEISRDAVEVVNEAGDTIYVNPAVEEVFGYKPEECLGTQIQDYLNIVHPDDRDRVTEEWERVVKLGETVYYAPMRCMHKDGSWIWIKAIATSYLSASGERYILEVSQDISEQVEAEQERQQLVEQRKEAQRLESLGVLAGGIAHDFNNLLTPILGDASFALLELPENSPARLRLQRIGKAAHRAAALTNQMLAYSGQRPSVIEPLDISQLVEEMAQLLEGAVSGKAELVYDLAEDLPAVEADSAQLSQVVMNLITNATEAVRKGAGRTVLRTGQIEAEKVECNFLIDSNVLLSGHYVFIEVIDNGCGMDAQTQSKIFDPFFTTKFTGRGLGLAAAIGIVRNHGGAIEIESEVGRGTRFRVLLPSAGRRVPSEASEDTSIEDWRGRGTVLVVDDDDGVRELVAETLRRAGLTVLLAEDGREAVALFRRQADEIRVVVLDRTMPIVDGEEAFNEIRRIRSDARIILVSGYSEEHAVWHSIDQKLDAFLHKPFDPMALLERVRRILEVESNPSDSE